MEEKIDVLNELGEFTGEVATRDECHKKGLWHRAVYAFIIDDKGNILLQKRSNNKKLWPNMWDVTGGGHVDAGELLKRISNNYEDLAEKTGPWNFLKKILEKYV